MPTGDKDNDTTVLTSGIPAQIGTYTIEGELGRGGMGVVYIGRDPKLDRRVAIKVLPAEWTAGERLERFEREARTAAQLSHPNIATIHELGQADDVPFIAMELVGGRSLHELLRGREPLPIDEALDIAGQIADALSAAHRQGIVHRDLKPRNVMITPEGRVKILDFGLAKVIEAAPGKDQATQLTASHAILGTPGYMSPEQAAGEPVDAGSDVFSFGIVLYEILTGVLPFPGEADAALVTAVLRDTHTPASRTRDGLTPELDTLIDRCLEKDRNARYATAGDLTADLRRARESIGRGRDNTSSIAVLPFANLSPDPDNEYFTDGMAEEVITALSKIEALHVTSRTSSFAFKNRHEDVRRIGAQLGVRSVLEGSVRKAGNRLRITAQLINVADGYHLWTKRYDRDLEDVFAIQDEIAESIAKALKVVLTEKERRAIEKVPTTDLTAYDYYLRGLRYFRLRRKSLEFAMRMFRRAIEADQGFALAWAGIATCCSLIYMWWEASDEIVVRIEEASRRAFELDPELAESHIARGLATWLQGAADFDEVRGHFETAIRLDPKSFDAHYFYARACFGRKLYEEAARLFESAARVRPEDYQAASLLSLTHDALGHPEEAKTAARRSLDVIYKHLDLNPDDARAVYMGANGLVTLGQRDEALEWAQRALDLDPDEPTVYYAIACVYTSLGETDRGLDLMEKAVELGYGFHEWWNSDPDLDPIRDHPRFKALMEKR